MSMWLNRQRTVRAAGGQSAVELAMAIPILLLLLLGAVEMGRMYYASLTADDAARAGVEYGAQSLATASDINGMETTAVNDSKDVSGMTATASQWCECGDGTKKTCGDAMCSSGTESVYVEVDTQMQFHTLLNYPGITSSVSIAGRAIRRVGY